MRSLFIPIFFILPLFAEDSGPVKLPPHLLTNQSIVLLSEAGYGEDFLIDLIRIRPSRFDTSAEGLSYLAQHGLCEHIVRYIVARAETHEVDPSTLPAARTALQMTSVPGNTWPHAAFPVPKPLPTATCQIARKRHWLIFHHTYVVPTPQAPF